MEGLLAKEMILYQDEYLRTKKTKKTGLQWGQKCIRASYALIFNLWEHRNKKLHDTPLAADKEGQKTLDVSITNELTLGRSRLPARFGHFFNYSPQTLLQQSLRFKKNWFRSVRRAREQFDDPGLLEDDFSEEGSYFRKWINI